MNTYEFIKNMRAGIDDLIEMLPDEIGAKHSNEMANLVAQANTMQSWLDQYEKEEDQTPAVVHVTRADVARYMHPKRAYKLTPYDLSEIADTMADNSGFMGSYQMALEAAVELFVSESKSSE